MMEYISAFVIIFFSYFSYTVMYKILTNEKIKIYLLNIFLTIIFSFISLEINYLNNVFVSLIYTLLVIFFELSLYFNHSLKKTIYYSLILVFITLISDSITSHLIDFKNIATFQNFRENIILRTLVSLPMIVVSIILCKITFIKKYINLFFDKYFNKLKLDKEIILWVAIIISATIILFALNGYNRPNSVHFIISSLYILIFIVMLIISLILLYKEYQTKLLNKNIIEENKYIKNITKQDEEFKHNLINNLLGIKTVASKKVNNLIDDLILEYKTDYKNILNINELPEGVLSIIYRKAYEENIENLNLAVDNTISNELIDILTPKNYNRLCTSIGILFDNALDAIKSCKEKIIEISFLEDEEYVYYIQKNSFANVIDLEQTGTKKFTTKKSGHGIGLDYIKNLKSIEFKNAVINNMFITKLKIKKTKM